MNNILKRYKEFLELNEKFSDILDTDYRIDNRYTLRNTVKVLELSEEFGISFNLTNACNWENIPVDGYRRVITFGSKARISYPDDGRQPDVGETLYIISFPTGPYIFGEHYPQELFREFFRELVSYEPKYLDTVNKTLFFSKENAKYIHEDFEGILKKYQDRVKEDAKRIRVEKLKQELEELGDTK